MSNLQHFTEQVPGAVQPHSHIALADSKNLGNLRVTHPFQTQRDGLPVRDWKPPNRLQEALFLLCPGYFPLRIGTWICRIEFAFKCGYRASLGNVTDGAVVGDAEDKRTF